MASFLVDRVNSKLRKQFRSSLMVKNLIQIYKNTLLETTERRKNTQKTFEIGG